MFNPEKNVHEHLTDLFTSLSDDDVATLRRKMQKKSFFDIIIHILRIIYK